MGKREIKVETSNGVTWSLIPSGTGDESKINLTYDDKARTCTLQDVIRVYIVETIAEAAQPAAVAPTEVVAVAPAPAVPAAAAPPSAVKPSAPPQNTGTVVTAEDIERMKAASMPGA